MGLLNEIVKRVKRTPTLQPKRQPITFTLALLGSSTRGMMIALLQLQDGFLEVHDEAHATLWGAAVGAPMYLRMDDHLSDN